MSPERCGRPLERVHTVGPTTLKAWHLGADPRHVRGDEAGLLTPGRGTSARSVDLALLLGAALGIHLLSVGAVELAPEGSMVASWWPAAGLGTGLAAVVAPARRPLVLLAVLLGSLTGHVAGGHGPDFAGLYAVFCVVEVVITTHFLRGPTGEARLREMGDVARLAGAVVTGAATLGVLTATALAVGWDQPFVDTFVTVTPSHVAAQLLVVPAVLALRTRTRHRRPGETAVQAGLLVLVTELVFGVGDLPLAFLPMTVMVWGAVRLGLRTVTVELVLVVVGVTLLSSDGYGPLAVGERITSSTSTVLLQVFAVSYVLVGLTLALAVRQREEATDRVSESEALFRAGFTESLLGMLMLEQRDGQVRVVRANAVACHLLDGSEPDVVGQDLARFLHVSEHDELDRAVRRLVSGRSTGWRHEVASAAAPPRWLEMALSVLPGEDDSRAVLSVQLVDVTARRDAEAQLARLALHDPLTGLGNRVLLDDRLAQVLLTARRCGVGPTLLFIDLDDFKRINDEHGHAIGDAVLRSVADRLLATARASDTVARLGGDEFVVLCPGVEDPSVGQALADRMVAEVSRPITVVGREVVVRLSVGVVTGAPDCAADDLLRDADIAMYRAKAQGKGRAVLYLAPTPGRRRAAALTSTSGPGPGR